MCARPKPLEGQDCMNIADTMNDAEFVMIDGVSPSPVYSWTNRLPSGRTIG